MSQSTPITMLVPPASTAKTKPGTVPFPVGKVSDPDAAMGNSTIHPLFQKMPSSESF
jgi:hypothetical protein